MLKQDPEKRINVEICMYMFSADLADVCFPHERLDTHGSFSFESNKSVLKIDKSIRNSKIR